MCNALCTIRNADRAKAYINVNNITNIYLKIRIFCYTPSVTRYLRTLRHRLACRLGRCCCVRQRLPPADRTLKDGGGTATNL